MVRYFIFFAKLAFLMLVVVVFVAILSAFLALIMEKVFGVKTVRNYAYALIACPSLIYIYGLVVAGFHTTIDYCIQKGDTGWILYLLAGAIWAFMGRAHLSNFREASIREKNQGIAEEEYHFDRFAYKVGLLGYSYSALSFFVSIFIADFYPDRYFGLTEWYATIFL